ncbi:MAG: hypothetical protein R2941_04750 [Desulfobacterales bacterium]
MIFVWHRIRSLAERRELEAIWPARDQETSDAHKQTAHHRDLLGRQLFH